MAYNSLPPQLIQKIDLLSISSKSVKVVGQLFSQELVNFGIVGYRTAKNIDSRNPTWTTASPTSWSWASAGRA